MSKICIPKKNFVRIFTRLFLLKKQLAPLNATTQEWLVQQIYVIAIQISNRPSMIETGRLSAANPQSIYCNFRQLKVMYQMCGVINMSIFALTGDGGSGTDQVNTWWLG